MGTCIKAFGSRLPVDMAEMALVKQSTLKSKYLKNLCEIWYVRIDPIINAAKGISWMVYRMKYTETNETITMVTGIMIQINSSES
jgi:hypothetical protein